MARMDRAKVRAEDRAKAAREAAFREENPSGGRSDGKKGHAPDYFTALFAAARHFHGRGSQGCSDTCRALNNLLRTARGLALQPGARVQARLIWRWRDMWLVWLDVNESAWLEHAPGLKPDAEVTAVVVARSPSIRLRLADPAEAEGTRSSASPLDSPDH